MHFLSKLAGAYAGGGGSGRTRARRFSLEVPVRFRAAAQADWSSGSTRDISCTGLLVRGEGRVNPGTSVELVLEAPSQLTGGPRVRLMCQGRVARSAQGEFGVALRECRILPAETAESEQVEEEKTSAVLIHDLNNQLSVLLGSSELLLAELGQEHPGLAQLEDMREAALRIAAIARELRRQQAG